MLIEESMFANVLTQKWLQESVLFDVKKVFETLEDTKDTIFYV